ncbi:hypothetical protein R3P38DRAFT_2800846 [Favolaschia claudopus]|uniref:Uncharacterized protein n=1 Tax=Favolaschia claudopus TaxID=2862362 RepID=A0AAV9ZYB7_9AGAR
MSSVLAPSGETFTGNIKFDRPTLERLCAALQLKVSGKANKKPVKDDFLAAAKAAAFSTGKNGLKDPRFSGLVEGGRGGGRVRNSAHKASEDQAEQSKLGDTAITGFRANLKLKKMGITTDPAGQTRPLNSGDKPAAKGHSFSSPLTQSEDLPQDDNDDDEEEEQESSSNEDDHQSDEGESDKPKGKQGTVVNKGLVLLKITNSADPSADIMETFVPDMNIVKTTTTNGRVRHETDLRDLLATALQSDDMSPVKSLSSSFLSDHITEYELEDLPSKILRPGFSAVNSKLLVGKVQKFVLPAEPGEGETEGGREGYESMDSRVNTVALDLDEERGFFRCSVFSQPSSKSTAQSSGPSAAAVSVPVTSLTGAGSDRPQEIANARKTVMLQPTYRPLPATDNPSSSFASWGVVTNKKAQNVVDNFRVIDGYFVKFAPFSYKRQGYVCRSDYEGTPLLESEVPNWRDHCDQTFTKDQVIKAVKLGKSSTNEVHGLVNTGLKLKHPVAKYLELGGTDSTDSEIEGLEDTYANMDYGVFKSLLEDLFEDANSHKPQVANKAKAKAAATVKKRTRDSGEGSGKGEGETHKDKRRKKSKKGSAVEQMRMRLLELEKKLEEMDGIEDNEEVTSDNMDDDSDN